MINFITEISVCSPTQNTALPLLVESEKEQPITNNCKHVSHVLTALENLAVECAKIFLHTLYVHNADGFLFPTKM